MTQDEQFVPKTDYEDLLTKHKEILLEKGQLNEEVLQLREALTKVNAGIHKASDMVEGVAKTEDQRIITNLAMDLLKHHPKVLTIIYKGETVYDIRYDDNK